MKTADTAQRICYVARTARDMPSLIRRLRPRSLPPPAGPTRREVLERSLAAAALTLAGCRSNSRRSDSAPRVVVVGAGLAGLACAHELRARGSDVVVIEARKRVGGRVHSLHDVAPGSTIEAGGEFIGANHPCWLGYARLFGLPLEPVTGEDTDVEIPVILQGTRIGGLELEALWRDIDQLQNALTKFAREVDGDAPWNHPFASAIDMRHMHGWVEEQQVSRLARHAFRVLLAADAGVPTNRQSLLATLSMISGGGLEAFWTSSESYRCGGGNDRLARALATAIGDARVITGSPVTRIRWSTGSVEVTCASSTFRADRVVLATPPTTWPRVEFDPPLPAGIAPQLGRSVKYLAGVKHRVWHDSGQAPEALTDGPITLTWESTSAASTPSAVITAFSSGEAADHLRSLRGKSLKDAIVAEFDGLYPGFAEAFVAGRFLDWPGDEWTRAGYSFPAPGETTTRVRRLREPFDALIVAGEHTSSRFPGYMEGALESGVRAADTVLRSG